MKTCGGELGVRSSIGLHVATDGGRGQRICQRCIARAKENELRVCEREGWVLRPSIVSRLGRSLCQAVSSCERGVLTIILLATQRRHDNDSCGVWEKGVVRIFVVS